MMRRALALILVLFGATTGTACAYSTVTIEEKEQAACYNDVQKFCGDVVPDVDKTTACMLKVKNKVSPGCAKYYPEHSK